MGRIRYGVAMSLDGYIAGPHGEADWIAMDPEMSFAAIWAEFDTLLMGRKTYEVAVRRLGMQIMTKNVVVASRTLGDLHGAEVQVLREVNAGTVQALRRRAHKDIWLMGGGELFRSLLQLGEVDGVDVSVMPVLLGGGVPLLPEMVQRTELRLQGHRVYGASGTVVLRYDIER